jgi:hypothetical protein
MLKISATILLATLGIAGCATKYGDSGLTGGYFERNVNSHLVKVNFSGNGYITSDKVQLFALYRCAQLARDAKKPYFVLYDSLNAAARDIPAMQPKVGTMGGKPIAFAFMALEDEPRSGSQEVTTLLEKLRPQVESASSSGGNQQ